MNPRAIKISFTQKRATPGSAFKVFTTMRKDPFLTPTHVHICYLPDQESINPEDKAKIEEALKTQWYRYTGEDNVIVDWENALPKWQRRHKKKPKHNRPQAKRQLKAWLNNEEELLLKSFKGPKEIPCSYSRTEFWEAFYQLSELIAKELPQADPVDVAKWWEESECPILLLRYRDYLKRTKLQPTVTRKGFIEFLKIHIKKGYAKREFLRAYMGRKVSGPWVFGNLSL